MLELEIPLGAEMFNEETNEFILPDTCKLTLEHSLVSLSKWESKWHKAFLGKEEKTDEEVLDYIKCMTLTENVDPGVYDHLTRKNVEQINAYIADSMTATQFGKDSTNKPNREVLTAEVIYYWMIELGIPVEFQYWHLNRLITLIRVCSIKKQPPKKTSKAATARHYAELNAKRREMFNSKG